MSQYWFSLNWNFIYMFYILTTYNIYMRTQTTQFFSSICSPTFMLQFSVSVRLVVFYQVTCFVTSSLFCFFTCSEFLHQAQTKGDAQISESKGRRWTVSTGQQDNPLFHYQSAKGSVFLFTFQKCLYLSSLCQNKFVKEKLYTELQKISYCTFVRLCILSPIRITLHVNVTYGFIKNLFCIL